MSANSKIEWTDHTFNPWWGCTHVHEGCRHCYAETWANRFGVKWGPSGVRRLSSDAIWKQPLKWNRDAAKAGVRAKVFCASMADVFEDWTGPIVDRESHELWMAPVEPGRFVPWRDPETLLEVERQNIENGVYRKATLDDVRQKLFQLIDATPHLDWQLLTKRPQNIRSIWMPRMHKSPQAIAEYFSVTNHLWPDENACINDESFRPNVCLGTSIGDQASADNQIHTLQECRDLSPVLFLSIEPLLGPMDLDFACARRDLSCIDWVIAGGESGNGARPMHPDWVRSLRDQCIAAEVPFFFKQWGEWIAWDEATLFDRGDNREQWITLDGTLLPERPTAELARSIGATRILRVGKDRAGRKLDGREWSEFPIVESEAV